MERNVSSATRTTDRKILYHFLQNVKSTTILLYFIKLAQSFCTFTKLEVLLLFPKGKLKLQENCSLETEIQLFLSIFVQNTFELIGIQLLEYGLIHIYLDIVVKEV